MQNQGFSSALTLFPLNFTLKLSFYKNNESVKNVSSFLFLQHQIGVPGHIIHKPSQIIFISFLKNHENDKFQRASDQFYKKTILGEVKDLNQNNLYVVSRAVPSPPKIPLGKIEILYIIMKKIYHFQQGCSIFQQMSAGINFNLKYVPPPPPYKYCFFIKPAEWEHP
ncbi:hypothetical protein PPERSA_09234 [Pseudocohnilembus persalinus]|uniref:Uncharacterized protein n=1 Tax=Pseudocohnilembus persalinus TaxID=266149 RepID=A0A0V0R4E1_PSEPJ|nr:hypothetical protein PPERSA_09234 [Pseudocohnilembus persalinus]|eukprot:KRX09350.1 hypothetical protein PPERSA_09234 [Pseudocohnilembus persalinus]